MARQADGAAIRACLRAAFTPYVPLIGRAPAPMEANPADAIARGHAYVSTDLKDRVLGVAIFYPLDGAMRLDTVAVHPHASGRGLGRAMIAHCEARAQADGLTGVTLYTNAAMTANLALYPQLGYREVGRRTEGGFDRVFFEKRMPRT